MNYTHKTLNTKDRIYHLAEDLDREDLAEVIERLTNIHEEPQDSPEIFPGIEDKLNKLTIRK